MGIFDILGKAVTAFKKGLGIMKEEKVITGYVPIGPSPAMAAKAVGAVVRYIKPAAKIIKPLGKVIGAVGKPVIAAVVKRPALAIVGTGILAAGAGPKIVKTLFTAGKVTGEVITGEKALTAETIAEVGKGLGIVAGVGAVGVVAGVIGKKILEKKEEAAVEAQLIPEKPELIPEKAVGIEGEVPLTPETAPLTEKKRVYKPRRAKKVPSVRQYVRINIISKPSAIGMRIINKRYISQEILA